MDEMDPLADREEIRLIAVERAAKKARGDSRERSDRKRSRSPPSNRKRRSRSLSTEKRRRGRSKSPESDDEAAFRARRVKRASTGWDSSKEPAPANGGATGATASVAYQQFEAELRKEKEDRIMSTVGEHKTRGTTAFGNKDWAAAIEAFTAGITNFTTINGPVTTTLTGALQELLASLHSNRAGALIATQDYEGALKDAETTIQIHPKWPTGFTRKATALRALNKIHLAVDAARQGYRLDPSNEALKSQWTTLQALIEIGDRKDVGQNIEEYKSKGNTAFTANDYPTAIAYYSKAIELDPNNQVFYSNRSAAHCATQDYDNALEDANHAVELKPDWSKAWSRKGAALHGMKEFARALTCYKKALELDPGSPVIISSIASVEAELASGK